MSGECRFAFSDHLYRAALYYIASHCIVMVRAKIVNNIIMQIADRD